MERNIIKAHPAPTRATRVPAADLGADEFRRGWPVALSALVGICFGLASIPFYTFGVFAPHLAAAFHWSIAEIMAGLAVTALMVAWAAPVAGILATRFGTRRIALVSVVLLGGLIMTLALTDGSLTRFYATWALISVAGAGTLPITWTRAVNQKFEIHKGLAIGVAMTGTGLFGMLSKPFLTWVIGDWGWRAGYVALGLLPLLISLPIALLFFRDDAPSLPHRARQGGGATEHNGLTLGEALHSWRFWLLVAITLPVASALSGPVPNLEIILREGGLDTVQIVGLTPLIGLTAILGRLAGGWLMDRFWAPAVGFAILILPAISCILLMRNTIPAADAAGAIVLIGFALGVEYDLIAFLAARYFGLRNYTAIYGLLYVCCAIGGGVAPVFYGSVHDLHGDYKLALELSAAVLLVGATSLLLLGPYARTSPLRPRANPTVASDFQT